MLWTSINCILWHCVGMKRLVVAVNSDSYSEKHWVFFPWWWLYVVVCVMLELSSYTLWFVWCWNWDRLRCGLCDAGTEIVYVVVCVMLELRSIRCGLCDAGTEFVYGVVCVMLELSSYTLWFVWCWNWVRIRCGLCDVGTEFVYV